MEKITIQTNKINEMQNTMAEDTTRFYKSQGKSNQQLLDMNVGLLEVLIQESKNYSYEGLLESFSKYSPWIFPEGKEIIFKQTLVRCIYEFHMRGNK